MKSAIHAHGPISVELIESAVKRVVGNLLNAGVTYVEVEDE